MNNALPPYVFLPTGLFLAKLIAHKEGEDRSKWVTDFAVQLVEGAGRDDFARSLIDTAVIKQNASMNRVRRSRAKSELISEGVKNPTRQQIEERLKEIYAEEEITAAAATREGVDVSSDRESGPLSRTTGCNHSCPDASVGNAEEVVLHGSPKGSRSNCTSRTSWQTFDMAETLDKAGAGEVPPESASAKPSPALPVLSFGEFGNVKMTNIQYGKLCERFNYADSVIEEADQYFEAQPAKKKKYKNHYAMLLNWCKRRETESKPKQGYMTSDDISKKNYEESKARLEAMFSKGRKTA